MANGCRVGPAGTVQLIATTEAGRRSEVAYRSFRGPGARVYDFQQYVSRVKLVYNGQTAWEVYAGNQPGIVTLKDGETMQEFLKRNEHPNYAWFSTVELPKLVQKPVPAASPWEPRK